MQTFPDVSQNRFGFWSQKNLEGREAIIACKYFSVVWQNQFGFWSKKKKLKEAYFCKTETRIEN